MTVSIPRSQKYANRSNIPHDAVELKLRNLRTLESVLVEWVTDDVLGSTLLEALDELIVDTFLDVDTRTSTAALTVVVKDTKVDPRDGIVDIGVVEDNVRALATELEGDLLEVGASSSLHDGPADNSGAGEGDLVDVHVRRDGGTSDLTKAGEDIDDTWRETSLLDELSAQQAGQRSLLGGLEDDSVAGCDGRTDLPGPHEQGEVPWDNLTADTDL